MIKELDNLQLKVLCKQISEKLKLDEKSLHVAALFQDNSHDGIIGWAILDSENNVVDKFIGDRAIENMFEKYD